MKNPYTAWLDLASARTWAEGLSWYANANAFATSLSADYGITLPQAAGVIAALSASVRWSVNKVDAENLCRSYAMGRDMFDVTLHTYGKQAEKARMILDADPGVSTLNVAMILGRRAWKTQAFFWCILDPTCQHPPVEHWRQVCIDRHMISAAGFDSRWTPGAHGCYVTLAELVIDAQRQGHVFLTVAQIQAIVWCTYKDVTKKRGSMDPKDIDDGSDLPI